MYITIQIKNIFSEPLFFFIINIKKRESNNLLKILIAEWLPRMISLIPIFTFLKMFFFFNYFFVLKIIYHYLIKNQIILVLKQVNI